MPSADAIAIAARLPWRWSVKRMRRAESPEEEEQMPSADAIAIAARLPWRWNAKRMRRAEKTEEEEKDLLSSLPDSMIGHIFSFLSIKDILRTTAVSKRWNHLWTNTPSISYTHGWSESFFSTNFPGLSSSLDRVFSQCSLKRFQIERIQYSAPKKQVFEFWLCSSIAHRVQDITLTVGHPSLTGGPTYVLPEFFFAYPSLVSLQLHNCEFTLCHGGVSWNSLKVLHVGEVEMADGLINEVLNGSPALECLELVKCWGMNHIRINSRKLRELVIDGYSDPRYLRDIRADEAPDVGLTLGVSAPHLLSLQILGYLYGKREVRLHQVSSLVQAKLDFQLVTGAEHLGDVDENLTVLLTVLSSVNSLMIGSQIMMRISLEKIKITTPALRLKTLIVGSFNKGLEFLGLIPILGCTRRVEKLVIYLDGNPWPGPYDVDIYGRAFGPLGSKILEKPWANHLKTIEINGFRATPPDRAKSALHMIGFLLREAVVLEKMVINAQATRTVAAGGVDNMEELQREVVGFPRGSKASKVFFSYLLS